MGERSGVLKGGTVRCPPPFGPTMKIFYRRLYMKRCVFCHFLARIAKFNNVWWFFALPNFRKMGEFAVSIKHSEAKSVSASGGLGPLPPRPGALPLDPAGGSARSPWSPLCQILNTSLGKRKRPRGKNKTRMQAAAAEGWYRLVNRLQMNVASNTREL